MTLLAFAFLAAAPHAQASWREKEVRGAVTDRSETRADEPRPFPDADWCASWVFGPGRAGYDRAYCVQSFQNGVLRPDWEPRGNDAAPTRALTRPETTQFYHFLMSRLTYDLAFSGRLGRNMWDWVEYRDDLYWIKARLTPEQGAQLAQAVATQFRGHEDLRVGALYNEAFSMSTLPRLPTLRAIGQIGGPMAISVLSREGALSEEEDVRQAALQALSALGGEAVRDALAAALTIRERQSREALERLAAEETAARDQAARREAAARSAYEKQQRDTQAQQQQRAADVAQRKAAIQQRRDAVLNQARGLAGLLDQAAQQQVEAVDGERRKFMDDSAKKEQALRQELERVKALRQQGTPQ